MAEIQNIKRLKRILQQGQTSLSALRGRAAKTNDMNVSVVVGYTAAYAMFVHEDIEMKLQGEPRPGSQPGSKAQVRHHAFYWSPNGMAKFLEVPARQFSHKMGQIIRDTIQKGRTIGEALLMAGLFLQRESQARVPVDFGVLKASATTRIMH